MVTIRISMLWFLIAIRRHIFSGDFSHIASLCMYARDRRGEVKEWKKYIIIFICRGVAFNWFSILFSQTICSNRNPAKLRKGKETRVAQSKWFPQTSSQKKNARFLLLAILSFLLYVRLKFNINCNSLLLFNNIFFICVLRVPTQHYRVKKLTLAIKKNYNHKMMRWKRTKHFQKNNISQCDVFIHVYNFVSLVLNSFYALWLIVNSSFSLSQALNVAEYCCLLQAASMNLNLICLLSCG